MSTNTVKPKSSLGRNLRHIRENAGLTQLELAHLIGYDTPQAGAIISRIECGAFEPRLDKLGKIAEVLKCTVDELLN